MKKDHLSAIGLVLGVLTGETILKAKVKPKGKYAREKIWQPLSKQFK